MSTIIITHFGGQQWPNKFDIGRPGWTCLDSTSRLQVEPGESVVQGAVREVREECGLLVREENLQVVTTQKVVLN